MHNSFTQISRGLFAVSFVELPINVSGPLFV
jgi:hypothetical protein